MKTSYFKQTVPPILLFTLLKDLCVVNNNCYMLTIYSFQRGVHDGKIQKFISDCTPYYLENKQSYVTKELTYKSFLTVVRHICKTNNIKYDRHIQYQHSNYQIVYFIHTLDIPVDMLVDMPVDMPVDIPETTHNNL